MTPSEFLYHVGIGRRIQVTAGEADAVLSGVLSSVEGDQLILDEQPGFVPLPFSRIKNIAFVDEEFEHTSLKQFVDTTRKHCQKQYNKFTNLLFVDIYFQKEIEEIKQRLAGRGETEAQKILDLFSLKNAIRHRILPKEEVPSLERTLQSLLSEEPRLSRIGAFLIAYSASEFSECMAIASEELREDNPDSFVTMAMANLFLGRCEAMYLFWMEKYFLAKPQAMIDPEDLVGFSPLWNLFLNLSFQLNYYEGVKRLISHVAPLDEPYKKLSSASLIRLFQLAGSFHLAREAASLYLDFQKSGIPRPVEDLTRLLYTDQDGYCIFAHEAAEQILSATHWKPEYYSSIQDYRSGYIYDYANGRHYGRILGSDLLTYFLPAEAIPEDKKKQIQLYFDLSQYHQRRELMRQELFMVTPGERRTTYVVQALL